MRTLQNWLGSVQFRPAVVARPRDEDELCRLVRVGGAGNDATSTRNDATANAKRNPVLVVVLGVLALFASTCAGRGARGGGARVDGAAGLRSVLPAQPEASERPGCLPRSVQSGPHQIQPDQGRIYPL